jgi:hypothetical protein
MSAGADKRFGTGDDFSVDRFSWSYFRPTGEPDADWDTYKDNV